MYYYIVGSILNLILLLRGLHSIIHHPRTQDIMNYNSNLQYNALQYSKFYRNVLHYTLYEYTMYSTMPGSDCPDKTHILAQYQTPNCEGHSVPYKLCTLC